MTTRPLETEGVVRALRSITLPAQLERGCTRCTVGIDADAPNTLVYTQDWSTEQDLARHVRSDHFVRLLFLMETAVRPPELEFLFISDVRGLDFVETVRDSQEA